jgi:phosphomannomutase
MSKIEFGTDGWRALMDKDFTFQNVELVAQGFADFLNADFKKRSLAGRPKVVIGYDTRKNSENFSKTFAEVLNGNEIDVLLSDQACPTPAVSFTIVNRKYDAGIVVNGIKIKTDYGSSADKVTTDAVEGMIGKGPVKKKAFSAANPVMDNLNDAYLAFLAKYVRLDVIRGAPYRILVDSMHGVGASHIENILKGGKIHVSTIRQNQDITFGGINPEPIPQNLGPTTDRMKRREFNLAVVTDGDADRIGAVRPGGEFISPGIILSLIMIHMVEDLKRRGSVVTTISNTALIYKVARKLGLTIHETPVGFKYVCEIMRRENVLIGGEESGGIGFQDYLYERDGMLSALLLIEMMAMRRQSFDEILSGVEKEYGKLYYVRSDLTYPNELKPKLFQHLTAHCPKELKGQRIKEVKSQDGMKFILEDDSWLLCRLSGTEPILRIYSEATSKELAEALVKDGKELAFSLQ